MLGTVSVLLRGIPFIYQGQEIGMENAEWSCMEEFDDINTKDQYQVAVRAGLSERAALEICGKMSRDNARTPVQWNGAENAGFTTGTPWLSVNGNYKEINVENSRKNPDSLFYYYKTLIALRKNNDVLIYGKFQLLDKEHPEIFAYERTLDGKKIVVICNFTDHETQMEATEDLTDGKILIHNQGQNRLGKETWILGAYEAWMIEIG